MGNSRRMAVSPLMHARKRIVADRRQRLSTTGFTLLEALVSIAVASMAGTALLLSATGSSKLTTDNLRQTIAIGMAQQLMDEVVGNRYMEYNASPYGQTLGPEGAEATGGTRQYFDDIDDYNGFRASGPVDMWGIPLGKDNGEGGQRHVNFQSSPGFFDRWQQDIKVFYVAESSLSTPLGSGQTSDYRLVQVRVLYNDPVLGVQELVKLQRVVAYVPPLP
jgi:type II secretory pathway pseudopilin PulG